MIDVVVVVAVDVVVVVMEREKMEPSSPSLEKKKKKKKFLDRDTLISCCYDPQNKVDLIPIIVITEHYCND